jgi:hypothetical protein
MFIVPKRGHMAPFEQNALTDVRVTSASEQNGGNCAKAYAQGIHLTLRAHPHAAS